MGRYNLEKNVYEIKNKGILVDFNESMPEDYDEINHTDKKFNEVVYWGEKNRLPDDASLLKTQNGVLLGMLDFKFKVIRGGELYVYKKEIVDNKEEKIEVIDEQIQEWIENAEYENFLNLASRELAEYENFFAEFIFSKDYTQINKVEILPNIKTRISFLRNKFFFGDWKKNEVLREISAIDLEKRQANAAKQYWTGSTASQFYPSPTWYGAKSWVLLSTKIPLVKLHSLDNSMQIRYLIKMPKNYIRNMYEGKTNPTTQKIYTPEEILDIQRDFKKNIIDFLTGLENTDKAIFTETEFAYDGKKVEFEIESLEDKKKYDAYLEDFQNSTDALMSSLGIDESLAAVHTGRISSSGSDKRNSWNIQVARYNTERNLLVAPLNKVVKKKNGWNKKHFVGIRTMELTTTDLVKSGRVDNQ